MKISRYISYLLIFATLLGCAEDYVSTLDLSSPTISNSITEVLPSEEYLVDETGGEISIQITANSVWSVVSSQEWCRVYPSSGSGDGTITITIEDNSTAEERSCDLSFFAETKTEKMKIKQSGSGQFSIPLIFHVLYSDKTKQLQYVPQSRINEVFEGMVEKFNESSQDMGITFSLATTDPDGKSLSMAGIEYVHYTEEYPIDFNGFMLDDSGVNTKHIWDPNKYVNIMLYNFKEANENVITFGVSHMPFTCEGAHYLEGTTQIDSTMGYMNLDNLNFAYCVSINSLYINEESTASYTSAGDIYSTIAHELGHYFGLLHVFSDEDEATADVTKDSDYCDDTPNYFRLTYETWLQTVTDKSFGTTPTLSDLVVRTNALTGGSFNSTNIMDYYWSYSNKFTEDQRARVRHVLMYSPLIPGLQNDAKSTKSMAIQGKIDLPIVLSH